MKKLLFFTVCFLFCFLFSCKDSVEGEQKNSLAKDSAIHIQEESEPLANDEEPMESIKADTSYTEAVEEFLNLDQVKKRLNKKASYFVIKNNRDTVIKCKDGTLLSIPANAFINTTTQKPVTGEVKISVKEFYKTSDMIMAGLTTSSNGNLLETGGMLNIKVSTKDKKDSCALKPGKEISIAMPNSQINNMAGMQLFNGSHDSADINWTPRPGLPGLAQPWRRGRGYFPFEASQTPGKAEFVFPDETPKTKPLVINTNPDNFQTKFKMSVRDLLQSYLVVTKKANAYIDTAGNLHCYRIGGKGENMVFPGIYSPSTSNNMKVNLAVDVNLSYKSTLNYELHQKLLKMGKGNLDSLVELTITLNPEIKLSKFEILQKTFKEAITVKQYQKKERYRALLRQQYERKINQLRLNEQDRLAKLETNSTSNLGAAQDYLLLSTSKLGWINCDRFSNSPEKTDYLVTLKEPASVLIVFNNIKSIVPADKQGIFHGVPLNEKITIVALKTKEGKLMMALHETTVTEQAFAGLHFEPVTVKEYKSKLEKLNRL